MRYEPTRDECQAAAAVARIRNSKNGGQTNLPGGETSSTEERYRTHCRAALAEIVVARHFNLCWSGCGKGATGLRDVGNVLEVRHITERARGLLVRGKDEHSAPVVLVLVNDDRSCELLGWEFISEVKRRGRCLDAESAKPCWILAADGLRPIEELGRHLFSWRLLGVAA